MQLALVLTLFFWCLLICCFPCLQKNEKIASVLRIVVLSHWVIWEKSGFTLLIYSALGALVYMIS